MRKRNRRPFSYANVVATLALVLAMSGGALAASHYLITSTKQISPKVLKKLKGKTGRTGATGASGASGREGPQGREGLQGREGTPGVSNAYEQKSKEAVNVSTSPKVLTITLPAGSYDISAKAQEQNEETLNTATVTCEVSAASEVLDSAVASLPTKAGALLGEGTAVLHSGLVTAGTSVTFSCVKTGGASKEIKLVNPSLSAVQVGALH